MEAAFQGGALGKMQRPHPTSPQMSHNLNSSKRVLEEIISGTIKGDARSLDSFGAFWVENKPKLDLFQVLKIWYFLKNEGTLI